MAQYLSPSGKLIDIPDPVARNAAARPQFMPTRDPDLLDRDDLVALILAEAEMEEAGVDLPVRQAASDARLREIQVRIDLHDRACAAQRATRPVAPARQAAAPRPAPKTPAPVARQVAKPKVTTPKKTPVVTMATNAAVEPRWPSWMSFSDQHALIGLAAKELRRIEGARRAG